MILLVDNYDSFTYNLAHLFGELGADIVVRRNDAIDAREAERLRPSHLVISPGPGRVDEVSARRLDRQHVRPHRLRAAGDLVRRLALRAQRDEEPRDLRGRRLAGHHHAHDAACLVAAEVVPVEQPVERVLDHRSRKFRAICAPTGVRTDSGWNWSPSTGSSR